LLLLTLLTWLPLLSDRADEPVPAEAGMGENGGVGASGRLAEAKGRGVEPRDGIPPLERPGVLCAEEAIAIAISPVRGVSERLERPLRGVRDDSGGLRCDDCDCDCWSPTMVKGGMLCPSIALAHGLFEGSSTVRVRLSLLLSRMLLGSPRTAPARVSPDDAGPPELASGPPVAALELAELDVSICSAVLLDEFPPRDELSSSTQPAGVGGTGPSDETANEAELPGRRVGGDVTRSVDEDRLALCDLECGGGIGGGGGSGMPGSHLDRDAEEALERELDGVSIAPVDAALRDAGGRDSNALSSWRSSAAGKPWD
jgi:hypothetical protein